MPPFQPLGHLQADIMRIVWDAAKPVSFRDIRHGITARRRKQKRFSITPGAIDYVLNSLMRKGMLARIGSKKPYQYKATTSRNEYQRQILNLAVQMNDLPDIDLALDKYNKSPLQIVDFFGSIKLIDLDVIPIENALRIPR